ncbi:MAG: carbon storage regulator [Gammaproteobacteria bacterium]|nr:carbon storage regulator [Gammaproteobacteria bacterium]
MLVLTKKVGESVVIDGGIEGFVLENNGHQVRLGFNAPEEIVVVRSELLARQNTEQPRRP